MMELFNVAEVENLRSRRCRLAVSDVYSRRMMPFTTSTLSVCPNTFVASVFLR